VTSVFATWLKKHKLRPIRTLDILDCNGGDHGQAFATNFNPEINIREVTAAARHWENGDWVETPPLSSAKLRFRGRRPQEHVPDVSRGNGKPEAHSCPRSSAAASG
jgi:saccharopine dehydrogenase (NAD+, L-lysine-forming)